MGGEGEGESGSIFNLFLIFFCFAWFCFVLFCFVLFYFVLFIFFKVSLYGLFHLHDLCRSSIWFFCWGNQVFSLSLSPSQKKTTNNLFPLFPSAMPLLGAFLLSVLVYLPFSSLSPSFSPSENQREEKVRKERWEEERRQREGKGMGSWM